MGEKNILAERPTASRDSDKVIRQSFSERK